MCALSQFCEGEGGFHLINFINILLRILGIITILFLNNIIQQMQRRMESTLQKQKWVQCSGRVDWFQLFVTTIT